jgi:hypothetical protein
MITYTAYNSLKSEAPTAPPPELPAAFFVGCVLLITALVYLWLKKK